MESPSGPRIAEVRYGVVAQAFHWTVAALVLSGFGVGLYMVTLKLSPGKLQLFSYHKWIGVTVFLLALLRLAWRAGHAPPPLPPMPAWQHRVAQVTHWLLYLLLFAVPLSGWLMSSAKGMQTVWFGVLPIPDLLAKNKELGHRLEDLHYVLNKTLLVLIGLHVAAALKHFLFDRDQVLQRMLPRWVARGGNA
jgi:cytochrome b561